MQFIAQYLTYILIGAAFIVGFLVSLLIANGTKIGDALGKMWVYFGKANSEDNGGPSSMRINIFITVICFVPAITFGFIYSVINYKDIILLFAGLIMTTILLALGLKKWQKNDEELTNGTQKVDVTVAPGTVTEYPDGAVKTVTEKV